MPMTHYYISALNFKARVLLYFPERRVLKQRLKKQDRGEF